MTLYARILSSPFGPVLVAVDETGALIRVEFLGERTAGALEQSLTADGDVLDRDAARCQAPADQLAEYFGGDRREFDLPLAPRGTDFEKRVWEHLRKIPHGKTISYRELAARVGNPSAYRAVGRANGRNPIAIVIPCHRVIGVDGSLTGYGGGISLKAALLKHEEARLL